MHTVVLTLGDSGEQMASLEDIKTIGVIGAGQMGNGIAHVIALAGYDVRILDISQDALDKALGLMDKNMDRQVKKELITAAQKIPHLRGSQPERNTASFRTAIW